MRRLAPAGPELRLLRAVRLDPTSPKVPSTRESLREERQGDFGLRARRSERARQVPQSTPAAVRSSPVSRTEETKVLPGLDRRPVPVRVDEVQNRAAGRLPPYLLGTDAASPR